MCSRPARWLFAGGRPEFAEPLWEHPRLVRPAEIDKLLPVLRGAALTACADAEAAAAEVARLLGNHPGGPTSELWARVADAAGKEAGRAARWRLSEAARVGGRFLGQPEPKAMVFRTYGHHQPLEAPWAVVADVVTHTARVIAWVAIAHRITAQPRAFDPRIPSRARELATATARNSLEPVVAQLDADAEAAGIHWSGS